MKNKTATAARADPAAIADLRVINPCLLRMTCQWLSLWVSRRFFPCLRPSPGRRWA